ncbi:MAG: phosphoribosylamine--glycine ligase family protein, partial [Staphylococcus equorum]|nr:phosphoribosylamine--glycine ligase family protein [Staphylococcus equorum]
MKVLVIGAGGREHVIAHKLKQSPLVNEIFAIPGNDAMSNVAQVHSEIAETEHEQIVAFAQQHDITWAIIGPE